MQERNTEPSKHNITYRYCEMYSNICDMCICRYLHGAYTQLIPDMLASDLTSYNFNTSSSSQVDSILSTIAVDQSAASFAGKSADFCWRK